MPHGLHCPRVLRSRLNRRRLARRPLRRHADHAGAVVDPGRLQRRHRRRRAEPWALLIRAGPLGIISTANINEHVIPPAHASDKAELIAVASRDQAQAAAYAREWQIEQAYGSYEALLEDPDVEAVYISLPNSMHVEWSIRSVEAGKHVLCEKPFDRRPEEVERAFDAADSAGRLLMEAFMYRHNPQTHQLTELVRSGAIGELRVIRSAFSFSIYDPENIRLRTDVDGGSLMDVGCYCVSGSRLLAGEPTAIHGEAYVGPTGTTGSSPGNCASRTT